MKPSKKKIILWVVLAVIAAGSALFFTLCPQKCADWPMRYFPDIENELDPETLDSEGSAVIDIQRKYRSNHHINFLAGDYSRLVFVTQASMDEITDFLERNDCTVWIDAEYPEESGLVAEVSCDPGRGFLTYVEDNYPEGNLVMYEFFYPPVFFAAFSCCFLKPNLGE